MRIATALITVAFAANAVVGSTWFSKAAYNKWHETELERWLSDHDVPYPTPADRRDLEKLVQKNWDAYVVTPYQQWDAAQLATYLKQKGIDAKDTTVNAKDSLVSQVSGAWYETEDKAQEAYGGVKDWILDTWTESQLKAFCDYHGIPVPEPRKRDTLLEKARSSYSTVAQKAGDAIAYPGNWLYDTWTESDLKEWLDTNGIPAPQPTSRDKLIASVRRNSRLAYLRMQDQAASATASAQAAYATLTDKIIETWSESQLKEFCDTNGIPVPQGTKVNQLRALVRKHKAQLLSSVSAAYGAATSNVAQATDAASLTAQQAFNDAVETWSESRMKSYLDARGVPVPHTSKTDELRALVRKNAHKAASGYTAWTFDDFSAENLREYLASSGTSAAKKASEKAGASREELLKAASSAYASASSAGGDSYASVTSYLTQATDAARKSAFDTWSESDLKSYLEGYGVPVPQGSKIDELKALARKHWTYFKYGTSTPSETFFAKLGESAKESWQWVKDQLAAGANVAKDQAVAAEEKAAKAAKAAKEEL